MAAAMLAKRYRHAFFVNLEAAPTLVRATAFACFVLGPAVAGILLLPSLFLKPITVAINAPEPMGAIQGTIRLSTLVYRLGPGHRPVVGRRRKHRPCACRSLGLLGF